MNPADEQRPRPTSPTARKHLPDYEKKVRPLGDALEEGTLCSIRNECMDCGKTLDVL